MRSQSASLCVVSVVLLLLACPLFADVYMTTPRGSNNRLNEPTAPRTNANRVFDSQNNNRGGHNVGDRTASAFSSSNPVLYGTSSPTLANVESMYDPTNDEAAAQYSLLYMEGSVLQVEWTNQHGCGGNEANDPQKLNCDIILQYMCEMGGDDNDLTTIRGAEILRDGATTRTPQAPSGIVTMAQEVSDPNDGLVRHESMNYYYECSKRSRNQGLFVADQQLQGNTALYTRQNANGQQYGLECPEERDYYPYWNPSPWKDIAVLTDHPQDKCTNGLYNGASQNNNIVYRCIPTADTTSPLYNGAWAAIDAQTCATNLGKWQPYSHNLTAPVCQQAAWTRVNHHGNGRTGTVLTYNWTLPTIAELTAGGVNLVGGVTTFAKCVLRLRYNISTDDFNPTTTDHDFNGALSPIQNNQQFDIGAPLGITVQLQLNTAQLARTFQDRTHIFFITQRPPAWQGRTIYNLGVRGRRCNIVECYPAVEFDFSPASLVLNASAGDMVHIQWTGSNTDNNEPGNNDDGEDGDAGQGAEGTDRNNFVQMISYGMNYPLAYDQTPNNIISQSNCYNYQGDVWGGGTPESFNGSMTEQDVNCALFLWSSGYYLSAAAVQTAPAPNDQTTNDLVNLNGAPASLIGGVLLDFSMNTLTTTTTFPYMCTRNNAFTNRAQKGTITVVP